MQDEIGRLVENQTDIFRQRINNLQEQTSALAAKLSNSEKINPNNKVITDDLKSIKDSSVKIQEEAKNDREKLD